jgi:hypothetical protein
MGSLDPVATAPGSDPIYEGGETQFDGLASKALNLVFPRRILGELLSQFW